jgi:hypothetical protein
MNIEIKRTVQLNQLDIANKNISVRNETEILRDVTVKWHVFNQQARSSLFTLI